MTDALPLARAPAPPARGPSLETIEHDQDRSGGSPRSTDVSVKVPAGTFHALLGENGAGKSTLVKCIMGFYTPDKGNAPARRHRGRGEKSARRASARRRHGLSAFHSRARR